MKARPARKGLLRTTIFRLFAAAVVILAPDGADASVTAANQGFVGMWEYPSAEMPRDGIGRVGYTNASPYSHYYADLAWLPWLEVNARLTTFGNVFAAPDGGINDRGIGRDYMDKAFDVKAILHGSRKWYLPSVAFGMTDVMGTELSKAMYGVATWRRDKLAFSVGYGTERLNGFFAGASWSVADWLELKAEYSPLDYSLDTVGGYKVHGDAADSKYNFGAVFKAPWGMEGAVSWQRGEEFVFSLSHVFSMSGPFFEGSASHHDKSYGFPGASRVAEWRDADAERLGGDIVDALSRYVRVRDVEVATKATTPAKVSWTSLTPLSMLAMVSIIKLEVFCTASPLLTASPRTSSATTANPAPLSPARAASTAAFKAKRLVW